MLDTTVRWFVTITFHSPVNTFLIGTVMLWLGVMTCSRVRCIITCTKVNVLLNGSQMFKLLVKWSGHTFPHVYRNAVCTTAITDSSPKPNGSFHQHQECFPPLLTSETFGLPPHTRSISSSVIEVYSTSVCLLDTRAFTRLCHVGLTDSAAGGVIRFTHYASYFAFSITSRYQSDYNWVSWTSSTLSYTGHVIRWLK